MPRKQNGFGNSKSLGFKGAGRVDRGKGVGAFGTYPSNRRYGTSVIRTVIEKYNLDSSWTKWRQGYEIWNKAYYSILRVANDDYNSALPESESNQPYVVASLRSILYQGTEFEEEVFFSAWEFPTLNADVNTHYVVKRSPSEDADSVVGQIQSIANNQLQAQSNKQNGEIFVQGTATEKSRLLLEMIGDRLTDGTYSAILKNILLAPNRYCSVGEPALYKGKTAPKSIVERSAYDLKRTTVKVNFSVSGIEWPDETGNRVSSRTEVNNQGIFERLIDRTVITEDTLKDNYENLIGKIVYIPTSTLINSNTAGNTTFIDAIEYFGVDMRDTRSGGLDLVVLDPGASNLPPSMYDINSLPEIFKVVGYTSDIRGTYIFKKANYQRFYDKAYLTADLVEQSADKFSYSLLPFVVLKVKYIESDQDGIYDRIELTSEPYDSEITLYKDPASYSDTDVQLIFADKSFTKLVPSKNERFRYDLYFNVDPWQDETFTTDSVIEPDSIYACSCPSFSKAILATPQATQDNQQRKVNRQRRYPLPTAESQDRYDGSGTQSASGKITSWLKKEDVLNVQLCKHVIAAMFEDGIRVIEPNEYPTVEAREQFEEKMLKRIEQYDRDFRLSFERSGISLTEIVFALAQGLNLDDVEIANVVLDSDS